MQVEPSPTTGSFTKLPMAHDSSGSAIYPMTSMAFSNTNASDEGRSNYFEFKPYVGPNMVLLYTIFSLLIIRLNLV